ncbi:hypothetical protein DFP72DRAFT_889273 [Ephemerocybe angulata]|uniref:MYND-type domain-containing protein n=1 Tax=Ephemerocybe angulata TaxID=980116 RepID=A0A8H6I5M3_9AGAR|nr:hypothetical protein DFP72DRAFT_889273 [Tulosesus angulatus]
MATHGSGHDNDSEYLDEVANKAFSGSAADLLEMHLAMKDAGTYTLTGIRALLSTLTTGPQESASSGESATDTPSGAANLALTFLGDFPSLCPPNLKEDAVSCLQDAIPGMIRWVGRIIQSGPGVWPQGRRLELDDLEFQELVNRGGIVLSLIELCLFNKERTLKDIASNPYIIDLAVFLWVAMHKGDPLLCPLSDSRGNNPETYTYKDIFTKLFFIVSKEPCMAKAVAEAIMAERVCSPVTFVDSIAGHATLTHTFLPIDGLMRAGNVALHALFMEKKAPEQFMIVLSIIGTRYHAQLQQNIPAQAKKELKASSLQVLSMTRKVVEWCFNSYPYGVTAIQSVITKGVMKNLANCLELGNDPNLAKTGKESFRALYDYLARCSVFPKTLITVFQQMAICVTPKLDENKVANGLVKQMNTDATIRFRQMFQYIRWDARPVVCDNINHSQHQGLPALPEVAMMQYDKKCSGCRTALYCSQECQSEDWKARHDRECTYMGRDYKEYKRLQTPYSYNSRTFQLATLRAIYSLKAHVWAPARTPVDRGGNRPVITLDVTRWDILDRIDDLHNFITETHEIMPNHLIERFGELVKRFEADVKSEFGLVKGVFWFGDRDINLVALFKRARGAPVGRVDPNDFEVEGSVMFTCQRQEWKGRPMQLVGLGGLAGQHERLERLGDLWSRLVIPQAKLP